MPKGTATPEKGYEEIVRAIMESANLIKEVGSEPKVYRTVAAKTHAGEKPSLEQLTPEQIRSRLGSGESSLYYVQEHDPAGKRVLLLDRRVIPAIIGTL